MDNITNDILLIDRVECCPHDSQKIHDMDYFKIKEIMGTYKFSTFDQIMEKHLFGTNNFKFHVKDTFMLKDKQVSIYLNRFGYRSDYSYVENQTMMPKKAINYILINYFENNFNYFIIVVKIKCKRLSESFYENFMKYTEKKNIIFRQFLLTMMKYHYEENNNFRNESCENTKISEIINKSSKNYIAEKIIDQPEFLKNKLYIFQRANIYWMLNREQKSKGVILDEKMIINFGPNREFDFTDLTFKPKRNVETYDKTQLNYFNGGCLCDDVGLGKTVQIYSLCFMPNELPVNKNLIIIPNSVLYKHWEDELEKHVNLEHPSLNDFEIIKYINVKSLNFTKKNNIVITTYDNIGEDILDVSWTRVIIDEYHESIHKPAIYEKITSIKALYKWAVTATPFVDSSIIYKMVNFIASNKITNRNIAKCKMYIEVFADMFRKNTKKSVEQEINLPRIRGLNYYLKFSDKERLFYDTLISGNQEELITKKRQFCINPSLYFTENTIEKSFVPLDLIDDNIKLLHHEELTKEIKNLRNLKIKQLIKTGKFNEHDFMTMALEKIDEIWNIHVENNCISVASVLETVKINETIETIVNTMKLFDEKLKEINESKKIVIKDGIEYLELDFNEDERCGICLGEFNEKDPDENIVLTQCGHIFCYDCINYITTNSNNKKCPQCKTDLRNVKNYIIGNKVDYIKCDLIDKYGTKIANLINIVKRKEGKIVLFSHTPTLLDNIIKILNENSIISAKLEDTSIADFETDKTKILILSSKNNASGLNIICASTIIILEPLIGDYIYRRQIENQIIGRLHRIGQEKEIDFVRLIITDSIEQDIDKENKLNDIINEDKEGELEIAVEDII